jgi:hypothetical protein
LEQFFGRAALLRRLRVWPQPQPPHVGTYPKGIASCTRRRPAIVRRPIENAARQASRCEFASFVIRHSTLLLLGILNFTFLIFNCAGQIVPASRSLPDTHPLIPHPPSRIPHPASPIPHHPFVYFVSIRG